MIFSGKRSAIQQKGFSLLEVMISFSLLGVGALGLLKLHSTMELKSHYAIQSLIALNMAESKLEWFQSRSISGAHGTIAFNTIQTGQDPISAGYRVGWQVDPAIGNVLNEVKLITVSTKWTDRKGDIQKVELKTMLSKYSELN